MPKRRQRALVKSHYQTAHILENVVRNYNSQVSLTRQPGRYFLDGDPEPGDPELIRPFLDRLFQKGAWLALETYENWDDEGGQCYQAYIVAPEHVKAYHEAKDLAMYPADGEPYDGLFVHRHLASHPDQYFLVWAGPY